MSASYALSRALFVAGVSLFVQSAAQATALQFAGDGDRVNIALPALFSNLPGNDFTFTGRVRVDGIVTSRVLYAQKDTSNFATVLLGAGGTLVFYVVSGGTLHSLATSPLTVGQWTHFGARWNAATQQVSLIVNGVAATAGGGSSSTGTNGVFTLGTRTDGAQALNGALDELTLWPAALSDAQIADDAAGNCVGGATPVLSYDFEVGTPDGNNAGLTTLPDVSGNGVDGTLNNFALTGTTGNWVSSPYQGCADVDLALTLGAMPNPVTAGDAITWTASLVNSSSFNAANVTVSGEVPTGTTFMSLNSPAGFLCSAPPVGNSGPVVCSIATLPPGTYDFTLLTASDALDTPNTSVNANWAVTSSHDPNAANDSASTGVMIANQLNIQSDSTFTPFEQGVSIDVLANDNVAAGGAPLDPATLAANPAAHGNASCDVNGCTYTPEAGFAGVDAFTYDVCDSSATPVCGTGNVRIAVGPHASADSYLTTQDLAVSSTVAGNDVFPPGSEFAKVSGPAAGSVALATDGSFLYTPNAGYFGGDTFTYSLCLPAPDGGVCDFGTVELTVLAAGDRIFYDGFGM